MAIFDAAGRAAAAGVTIQAASLAFFDFLDAPTRVHDGTGPIAAGGFVWQGIGVLGAVSDIERAVGGQAPPVTFTLSGVGDEIRDDVMNARTRVKGRACSVALQFFDADTLQGFGKPYLLWRGVMDRLVHQAADADTWTAQLTAETKFARRGLPPFGALTDRDQQRRYPGDPGLFMIPDMQNRRRPWNPALPEK